MIIVSSSLRLSGELSEVTWGLMLGEKVRDEVGRLALVGWEDKTGGPARILSVGSFLYGDRLECFPISLKGLFSLQLSLEVGRCQPVQWWQQLSWAGALGKQ